MSLNLTCTQGYEGQNAYVGKSGRIDRSMINKEQSSREQTNVIDGVDRGQSFVTEELKFIRGIYSYLCGLKEMGTRSIPSP